MPVSAFWEYIKGVADRERGYFKDPVALAKIVKEVMEEKLGEVEVYLFGSSLEGKAIPGKSDIDLLVVSREVPGGAREQSLLKVKVWNRIGDPWVPLEIHFASEAVFEGWYKRFVKDLKRV